VSHLKRAKLSRNQPVHVNWRVQQGLPSLRRKRLMRVIERAFEQGCQRLGMRLVHYSVQSRHVHLICEAADERALSRGMQGLGIRLAKALNRALGRKGKVFADRYHSHVLETPREVRNALRYVLGNARRHAWQRGELMPDGALDPCSSARYFDGYRDRDQALVAAAWVNEPVPVAPARCWLLTSGWKRGGLLAIDDVPGRTKPRRPKRSLPA
jgi:REP element-mobilizing transposase RayT